MAIDNLTETSLAKSREFYEYIRKKSENKRFVDSIELSATLVLISFFIFFAIRPTVLIISGLVGDIKSKEVLSQQMRRKINSIVEAQDNFSKLQEKYRLIESALPNNYRFSQVAGQVYSLAKNNSSSQDLPSLNFQLNLSKNSTKILPADSDVGRYVANISVVTNYASLLNYLDKLANRRRVSVINSIVLGKSIELAKNPLLASASSSPSDTFTFTFPLEVFYWKNQ